MEILNLVLAYRKTNVQIKFAPPYFFYLFKNNRQMGKGWTVISSKILQKAKSHFNS